LSLKKRTAGKEPMKIEVTKMLCVSMQVSK
jgi:hypothetical protein